jgi:hypothetical protein
MSIDLVARLDDKLRARRESFDRIPVIDIAPLRTHPSLEPMSCIRARLQGLASAVEGSGDPGVEVPRRPVHDG